MAYDQVEHIRYAQNLLEAGRAFVTITLVDVRGSAPQIVGAKAIITTSGIESGTVGGGKIEAASIRYAQDLLHSGHPRNSFVVWNLQTDIGMTCGGEVKLFFEVHSITAWPIVVYGAGHVAQAVVRLLLQLSCHITCVDSRQEWLDKLPISPKLNKRCTPEPYLTVADQPENAFFVLMSRGHATDLPVLAEILRTRTPAYLGVIGSRQKASVLRRDLKSQGFNEAAIASFRCPMGMPIGNNTPEEIAVSIAAQLLEVRDANAGDATK